jgi:hypothetical protein
MSPQHRGTTVSDGTEHFLVRPVNPAAVVGEEAFASFTATSAGSIGPTGKHQMLRADMFVGEALRFLSRIRQHTFRFVAQRKVYRSRSFLPSSGLALHLFSNG